MTQFNRRQWLRAAGLTGTLALVNGYAPIKATTKKTFPPKPVNGLTRLSSNENPYGPSPKVREAIKNAFDMACRYPYAFSGELAEMIAKKEGVKKENVVITGGSTEGLNITGLTYARDGGEIIAGYPTFLSMLNYAKRFGGYAHMVPMDENLVHDLDAMAKRVNAKTRIVYICNPSNPTGTILDGDQYRKFCQSMAGEAIVFSDEAYFDYIEDPNYPTMLELVREGYNVIVAKTFSKVYGLAGMRLGYLIARKDIADRLKKNVPTFTNMLAIEAAKTALNDTEFYKYSLDQNRKGKKIIYETLDDLKLRYVKSHTNFVFFESGREITQLVKDMKAKGVHIGRPFPPLTKWCRISTGTVEEVQQFGKALKTVLT